ncbi:MAG: dynamin family protein [Candidatus Treponema excrementipullorum]|nr:dynamin family protein [Candidatus Treponema excrementipullorum]
MADIELKYNPYTKKVEKCTHNGKDLDLSSSVWGDQGKELGVWAGLFIEKMVARCNDDDYSINFEGIERDFNFLEDAAKEYIEKETDNYGEKKIKIAVHANNTLTPTEKFDELKNLFNKMQQETPFEELKRRDVQEMFNNAMSSDFEMAVVATMSSGKSTLINAMLGRDLLPARNEATTANLVRIHDIDGQDTFKAIAYNKDHKEIKSIEHVTQKDMEELNLRGNNAQSEDFVSCVELFGDIQGIDSTNMQLILTDTPGPNNSQNLEHKEHTYSLFNADYKPMILYVLNASQLRTNDDNSLLRRVAETMKEGGRQSQDRFIFALNKADEFDPDKGETLENVIEGVKEYLKGHGIFNPRIFPCDARSAKVFRQFLNQQTLTNKEATKILPSYTYICESSDMHFSKYAPLSPSNKKKQDEMIEEAEKEVATEMAVVTEKTDAKGRSHSVGEVKRALIYTGIPAIELAISEYLAKYALPAKLTKGVDSFKQKIVNLGLEAQANKELKNNKEAVEKVIASLKEIDTLVSSGELGKKLAEELKQFNLSEQTNEKCDAVREDSMKDFRRQVARMHAEEEIDKSLAEEYIHQLHKILQESQVSLKIDTQTVIREGVINILNTEIEKINKQINGIVEGSSLFCDFASLDEVLNDCSEINVSEEVKDFEYEVDEKVGEEWVKNENKKWYKPWTWFEEKGRFKDVYETKTKVNFRKYLDNVVEPSVVDFFYSIKEVTKEYAEKEQKKLEKQLSSLVKKIEDKIQCKVSEKQEQLSKKEEFEKLMEQNEKNLAWLASFNEELDSILKI